ncbi:restriction endonuclease subunit S [Rhodopirellula europaea]|nr:restriction endonuclease subunit S [Rhodopirellula europaea]
MTVESPIKTKRRLSLSDSGFECEVDGSTWLGSASRATLTITAIPHISPGDIRNFRVPLPPTIDEQAAIAEVLSDMDAEIAAFERRREKTSMLKQGMMQELLTGRTRLI